MYLFVTDLLCIIRFMDGSIRMLLQLVQIQICQIYSEKLG